MGTTLPAQYTSAWAMIDLLSVIKGHKQKLLREIKESLSRYKDKESRWHLLDVIDRLEKLWNEKVETDIAERTKPPAKADAGQPLIETDFGPIRKNDVRKMNCWQPDDLQN